MGLNADQLNAELMFTEMMQNPNINEMGIVGPPGSGKSWLVNHLLLQMSKELKVMNHLLDDNSSLNCHLTATSNESANLISEVCGMPASTIHSLLGLRVMDDYATGGTKLLKTRDYRPRDNALIIIDEAGWVDKELLDTIRESLRNCKVLYIYDHKQLTSINSRTKVASECAVHTQISYTAYLGINERNDNPIGALAKRFRDAVGTGIFPKIEPVEDYIEFIDDDRFIDLIDEYFVNNSKDAKILCWTNNQVREYNTFVRDKVYDYVEFAPNEVVVTNKPLVQGGAVIYATDQKIKISEVIDQGTLYGSEGYWIRCSRGFEMFVPYDMDEVTQKIEAARKMGVATKDFTDYFKYKNGFNDLRPLYASTVYKVQGRTTDAVFIDLDEIGRNPKPEEVLRQLHVAISRPRHKLYLYGQLPRKYRG